MGLLRLEHVFVWLLLRSGLLMTGGLCIRSIWSGGLCQGVYVWGSFALVSFGSGAYVKGLGTITTRDMC